MAEKRTLPTLIGVDTGGTFTDFTVITPDAHVRTYKLLSTPQDPGAAVLEGLDHLLTGLDVPDVRVVHGSTVATNAILERKGARVAFVTTEGFKDILRIGRQNRKSLYDLTPQIPEELVPSGLSFEIRERVDTHGEVVTPLDTAGMAALAERIAAEGADSVALVFLHAYANPDHESQVAGSLRAAGFSVSVSHEILPEHREYERASTTVLNAYVSPLMSAYLGRLRDETARRGCKSFRVMQSSGGVTDAAHAGEFAVHTVLSGPAGGVVGAFRAAQAADVSHIITFDMGGTSTDVSLLPGTLSMTTESDIEGYPLKVPVIDIHTVGAGGGSIAAQDAGGALRVGPQSAGANPGPACYGQGGEHFTVTDANVLLGRIPQRWFMGGQMPLDLEQAQVAAGRLAAGMNASPEEVAFGVLQVVNSNMERAVKVISLERGHDPRDFTLVSFGGAGSLHACELARDLQIPRVLIPPYPGVLSSLGMAVADVVKSFSQSLLGPLSPELVEFAKRTAERLLKMGADGLESDGVPALDRTYALSLDLRYLHQSYELTVPTPDLLEQEGDAVAQDLRQTFDSLHQTTYGHAHPDEPIELVAVRLRAEGRSLTPAIPAHVGSSRHPEPAASARVFFSGGWKETPIYSRAELGARCRIDGPAIVVEDHATTVVPPGCTCTVHPSGALLIRVS